jgi:hypothetical protein
LNLTVSSVVAPGQRGKSGTVLVGDEPLTPEEAWKLAHDLIAEVELLAQVELAQVREYPLHLD